MSIQSTIVVTAVVLWFAQGWYLNTRLNLVHDKLNLIFDELREESDDEGTSSFYDASADAD
jgi:hypothetical protein